jgi:DHA1 family bicyclomycin/chloramphenicol resistance-like MFS transporter
VLLGALNAMGAAAMDMYFPAMPTMARSFDVHEAELQLTLTTFLVGVALGQVVTGSLSDVYGRKRPLLVGVGCYVLAGCACAASQSIAVLTGARFVQGCCASAGIAIARAIVKDLYAGKALAHAYGRLYLVLGMAPVLAPSIGALVLRVTSWRGIFVVLALFGVVLFAASAGRLPETLPPERRRSSGFAPLLQAFGRLLCDGRFLGYGITLGFAQATLVVTLAGAPFVIQDHFGLSAQLYGLIFLAAALAMVVLMSVNGRLLRRFSERRLLLVGCACASLAGLGVVASGRLGLAAFVPCFMALFGAWGFVPANAVALGLRDHGEIAGAAAALVGVFQYGVGGSAAPLAGAAGGPAMLGVVIASLAAAAAVTAALTIGSDRRRKRPTTVVPV